MMKWEDTFRFRMHGFESLRPPKPGELSVSVKVRATSGCFHREHSPYAYELIERYLAEGGRSANVSFEEHESGPEMLVYLAVTTAGLAFAKSVVDLITAIIKARSESVKKGDRPSDPVEIIVRRVEQDGEFREEKVLRFSHSDPVDRARIEQSMNDAAKRLIPGPVRTEEPGQKGTPGKGHRPKKQTKKKRHDH
jgi:hypothetical protein